MSSYYNYLKKYSPEFLVKHESWAHHAWGRRSNFNQLVNFKGALVLTPRVFVLPGLRLKGLFYFLSGIVCVSELWGLWYFQEIYNKYTVHKWTMYQPYFHSKLAKPEDLKILDPSEEKKPFTRLKYQDRVKIIYDGEETPDITSQRRYRYR